MDEPLPFQLQVPRPKDKGSRPASSHPTGPLVPPSETGILLGPELLQGVPAVTDSHPPDAEERCVRGSVTSTVGPPGPPKKIGQVQCSRPTLGSQCGSLGVSFQKLWFNGTQKPKSWGRG